MLLLWADIMKRCHSYRLKYCSKCCPWLIVRRRTLSVNIECGPLVRIPNSNFKSKKMFN